MAGTKWTQLSANFSREYRSALEAKVFPFTGRRADLVLVVPGAEPSTSCPYALGFGEQRGTKSFRPVAHSVQSEFRMPEVDVEALVKERLSHWRELSKKHFPDSADLTLVVLKGHLVIEQQITALICHYCRSPRYVAEARFSFSQKLALARALLLMPVPDRLWEVLKVINSLRNDLAHNLEPPKLDGHVASARAVAQQIADASTGSLPRPNLDSDVGVLQYLVGYADGYLQAADSCIAVMETQRKYA